MVEAPGSGGTVRRAYPCEMTASVIGSLANTGNPRARLIRNQIAGCLHCKMHTDRNSPSMGAGQLGECIYRLPGIRLTCEEFHLIFMGYGIIGAKYLDLTPSLHCSGVESSLHTAQHSEAWCPD